MLRETYFYPQEMMFLLNVIAFLPGWTVLIPENLNLNIHQFLNNTFNCKFAMKSALQWSCIICVNSKLHVVGTTLESPLNCHEVHAFVCVCLCVYVYIYIYMYSLICFCIIKSLCCWSKVVYNFIFNCMKKRKMEEWKYLTKNLWLRWVCCLFLQHNSRL
jgi:hypothetical protein